MLRRRPPGEAERLGRVPRGGALRDHLGRQAPARLVAPAAGAVAGGGAAAAAAGGPPADAPDRGGLSPADSPPTPPRSLGGGGYSLGGGGGGGGGGLTSVCSLSATDAAYAADLAAHQC